jgi:protein-disulfide isomerase
MNKRTAPFTLAVPVNHADHFLGPESAKITVVEYGDFECPNCKQAAPAVKLLLDRYPRQVRLVFRHFPQEEIHPHAMHAALAAEAAGAQGTFWPMHDLLFENQPHLKLKQLRDCAQRLELVMERFDADMADEIYLQRIREQIESGNRSGVRSTPTFFINGSVQDVSFGLHALETGVEVALQK